MDKVEYKNKRKLVELFNKKECAHYNTFSIRIFNLIILE